MSLVVHRIERLFREHGSTAYEGARRESVSALDHALQCAQLAEWAEVDAALVVAALLHDIGHFVDAEHDEDIDDTHEVRAVPFLAAAFGPEVVEPVRLHVQAKRYLVTIDAGYAATLSPASAHSLALQGGRMSAGEARRFASLQYAPQAVALRRWDDLAKQRGRQTPPLAHYLALLEEVHALR
jgi:phosphonate degradation associated HDIG domain protein